MTRQIERVEITKTGTVELLGRPFTIEQIDGKSYLRSARGVHGAVSRYQGRYSIVWGSLTYGEKFRPSSKEIAAALSLSE